jgi:hypothetical protein
MSERAFNTPWGWTGILGIATLLVAGCSANRSPYEIVQRAGRITYEDGSPIPGEIIVKFLPQRAAINAKEHPKPATAEVGADGQFLSLTTWKYNDGIIPGKHKVVVLSAPNSPAAAQAVDREYGSEETTPLTIEVLDDSAPIDIKISRPNHKQ